MMMKFNSVISFVSFLVMSLIMVVSIVGAIWSAAGKELVLEWEVGFNSAMKICLLLVFDWMSLIFVSVVALISLSVLLYSTSYMSKDEVYSRFILILLMFIISMWILILSPNFISMLLGWDGLGVTSYLLVLYYQSSKSFNASMITALTNRVGDVGLLLIIAYLAKEGSWSFIYNNVYASYLPASMLFLLVLVAMTKSAQMPFSAWLPAAMAAPTPVSSLVHSSTLVTAGVYLLVRLNYIMSDVGVLWVLSLIGSLTMFMAGCAAMEELDMKKVIALSTLSQLGLMFMSLGLGFPLLAFFHLVAHAYFKAMLFMSSGCVIHGMMDYQDMRRMGGSFAQFPVIFSIIFTANLSLCGLPFMAGFFSKDLILELMMMSSTNMTIFILAMVSTGLTVLYSVRLSKLVFGDEPKMETASCVSEASQMEMVSIMILLLPSIMGGLALSWMLCPSMALVFLPGWMKLLIIFIVLSMVVSMVSRTNAKSPSSFKSFFHYMWFMPFMFSSIGAGMTLKSSKAIYKLSESSWLSMIVAGWISKFSMSSLNYIYASLKSSFIQSIGILGILWMLFL